MLDFQFASFPIITTNRLILREVKLSDAEPLFKLRNNPEAIVNTARPPFTSIEEAIDLLKKMQDDYAKRNGISWAITLKGNDAMIGGIGFWRLIKEHYRAEVGYSILPRYRNNGFTTEALIAIVNFGFEHIGIHSIEANLNPSNIASIKALEKSGFIKEGYFKENYYSNGEFLDTLTYGKVKSN